MKYNFNDFIKKEEIKQMATNLLYLFKYDRINKNTMDLYIDIYNDVNNTSYFIQDINKYMIKLENNEKKFIKIELFTN